MNKLLNWIKSWFEKPLKYQESNQQDDYREFLIDNQKASHSFFQYINEKYGERGTEIGDQPIVPCKMECSFIVLPRWYAETGYDQPNWGSDASELFN